jgi:glycosyltransferase involved in cell wall biosynthesis
LHERIEQIVVRRAQDVVVFNPGYAEIVKEWNTRSSFSPTWYDPSLMPSAQERDPATICWVGRLETPKDPLLALATFSELVHLEPARHWKLKIAGAGSLMDRMSDELQQLPDSVAARVELLGPQSPESVLGLMSTAGLFLMTSHPGYEGYPRVLVEAMASGLVPVVTEGSDTGGLVDRGSGVVTSRDPKEIAGALARAVDFDRKRARSRAEALSAPRVVGELFQKLESA